ncbi:hypothetical protein HPB51_017510 [Rhipicephalus microplus]|uniref:Uncharacterized protein n=1 Tax=Rhipicephalus microplus TaxID=6941 RepID=A0A9J6F597_RHIMP|nr:hypothetical protein HPB51_017510 [Rhipicephalus microplus]
MDTGSSVPSPAVQSLTKEEVTQAVQEALRRQSTQQKSLLEDERRRLMQSFAESFQVAISQFLQSAELGQLGQLTVFANWQVVRFLYRE